MPYRDKFGTVYVVVALPPALYETVEYLRSFEIKPGQKRRARTKVIRDLMHLGVSLHAKAHALPAEAST